MHEMELHQHPDVNVTFYTSGGQPGGPSYL